MIYLKNVSKSYDFDVLKNVSLNMSKNNIYIIKGRSGSGKTTLLNIIAGIEKDYNGQYIFCGKNMKEANSKEYEKLRNKIGYITQQSMLFCNLTIKENLLLIKNDLDKIIELSKEFDVFELLNHMPSELSGGERQRVSLIRTLLFDCDVIIADEPTSSLDYKNSLVFVDYLKKIKNKIIIVATHKNIFDDVANEIYNIEDGKFTLVYKNSNEYVSTQNKKTLDKKTETNKISVIYKYLSLKNKNKKFFSIVLFILIQIILFSLVALFHYNDIYFEFSNKKYPYQIVELEEYDYDQFFDKVEFVYDEYRYNYNEYNGYSLLKYDDSNFNIDGVIQYGYFPKKNTDILINLEFAKKYFNYQNLVDIIDTYITIGNVEFKVTGIVSTQNSNPFMVYYSNPFYSNIYESDATQAKPSFFIQYDYIKEIGEKVICSKNCTKLVKIKDKYLKDLYLHPKKILSNKDFLISNNYNGWKNIIDNDTSFFSYISSIVIASTIVVSIFSFIFISNQIKLILHYRKKEFGYLQLFHISKNKLKAMIILEYSFEILKSILISFIFTILLCTLLSIIININIFKYLLVIFMVYAIIIIYSVLVIYLPMRNILNKSIKELIK